MSRFLIALALAVFGLLFAAPISAQSTANVTHYFTGGLPFCSQCGTKGQYACSPNDSGTTVGNWNDGVISFVDPTPSGSVVREISVTLYGTWTCTTTSSYKAMFGLVLNGVTHAVRESIKGTNYCQCDTCDAAETLVFGYRNGIPSFNKGGSNTLKVDLYTNSLCLNRALITFKYYTTNDELDHVYKALTIGKEHSTRDCNICAGTTAHWCSKANNNTLALKFNDPIPSGTVAVGADVFISYNFNEKSHSSSPYSTLTVNLQSTTIGSQKLVDSAWRSACGCYGDTQFNSVFYQVGWPSYVYGGVNTLYFTVSKGQQSYGNICLGRVGVDIIYYAFGNEKALKTLRTFAELE